MPNQEGVKRDLLLVIISMLFIIFVTGTGVPLETETNSIVIP